MNTAVLHKKVLGMPMWALGGLGVAGIVMYHFIHGSSVGGAAVATTPTDATSTGDPTASDSGYPLDTGGSGGFSSSPSDTSGTDLTGALGDIGTALGSLQDQISAAPVPVDYSQQISDLTDAVGALEDQSVPVTGSGNSVKAAAKTTSKTASKAHAAIKKTPPKPAAKKAPPARGGQAKPVQHPIAKAAAAKKPVAKAPAPKKKPAPKKTTQATRNR